VYLSSDAVRDPQDRELASVWHGETLAAGADYTASALVTIGTADPGRWFLLFATDNAAYVPEGDGELNNVRATPILLRAPDVAVDQWTVPTASSVGESVAVHWSVGNVGDGATGTRWEDRVYLSADASFSGDDSLLMTSRHSGGLGPGESYRQTGSLVVPQVPGGEWWLILVADQDNQQFEFWRGENNVGVAPLHIATADVAAEDFAAPGEGMAQQAITLSWTARNVGQGTTVGNWVDRAYLSHDEIVGADDYALGSWENPVGLGPTDRYTQTVETGLPDAPSGDWKLLLLVDARDDLFEAGAETNNLTVRNIRLGTPDVNVGGVIEEACPSFCGPAQARTGSEIALTWTVHNEGSGPTTSAWTDQLFLSADAQLSPDDVALGSWGNPVPLAPGQQYSRSDSVRLPGVDPGEWHLILTTAWEFEGTTSKANNVAFLPIEITVPDLVASQFDAPASATIDQPLAVSWSVRNEGTGEAAGSWFERVYCRATTCSRPTTCHSTRGSHRV
jgi:hypothetical protein